MLSDVLFFISVLGLFLGSHFRARGTIVSRVRVQEINKRYYEEREKVPGLPKKKV